MNDSLAPQAQRTLDRIVAQAMKLPFWVVLSYELGPKPQELNQRLFGEFIRYPTGASNVWCFELELDAIGFRETHGGRLIDAR